MKTFNNYIQPFVISGKYVGKDITELDVDCSVQICSTGVDFFPKWKIRGNKLILEFTPKYVSSGKADVEMTIFGFSKVKEEIGDAYLGDKKKGEAPIHVFADGTDNIEPAKKPCAKHKLAFTKPCAESKHIKGLSICPVCGYLAK